MKTYHFCIITIFLVIQISTDRCRADSYLVEPQWFTCENGFRKAYITDEGELSDTYLRMNSDTVNAFSVGTEADYDLDISLELYNYHSKPYARYPQYYQDGNGKIRKSKRLVTHPVYGWVWGMKDMQHYNAVWMRSSDSETATYYYPYDIEYCVVTVNGSDTIYHKDWSLCHYDNRNSSVTMNRFWLQSRNNTVWIGGGYNSDVPWTIVHNVGHFGNLTGLYLGSAASAGVRNAIITVRDKPMPERTEWRRENLNYYFTSVKTTPIEGFWKVNADIGNNNEIKMGGDYELAIVKNGKQYDVIYLSGAKIYPGKWQIGMVKGKLTPNSWESYDLLWYDAEGVCIEHSYAIYKDNLLVFSLDKYGIILLLSRETVDSKEMPRQRIWSGSGFALSPSGYVATNYHVVKGATDIRVYSPERAFSSRMKATVVAQDTVNDLAILKIEDDLFKGFGELPYGFSTRTPQKGEAVFYLGYPRPDLFNEEVKTSTGHVSALNGTKPSEYMVSIDIDHGSSGSPVFDENGTAIGVMVSIMTNTSLTATFAIKNTYLFNLLKEIEPDAENVLTGSKIKELSHPEKVNAIAPYVLKIECMMF